MKRTSHSTRKVDLFGTGKDGFTGGTPGVEAATVLDESVMNHVQEEIANAIELFGGATLDSNKYDQLASALESREGRFRAVVEATESMSSSAKTIFASPNVVRDMAVSPTSGVVVAVGLSGSIATSDNGSSDWAARSPANSFSGGFHSVTWAGGGINLFVAVGDSGEIQTSSTGVTWFKRTSGQSARLERVEYADGVLVVVGYTGVVSTSTDGINWTVRTPINGGVLTPNGLTHHDGVWLATGVGAVSADTTMFRSANAGVSWTAVALDTLNAIDSAERCLDVGCVQGVFVALVKGALTSAYSITSYDLGLTWQQNPIVAGGTPVVLGVGSHTMLLIATEPNKISLQSQDLGKTWSQFFHPGFGSMHRLLQLNWNRTPGPGPRRWAGLGTLGNADYMGSVVVSRFFTV